MERVIARWSVSWVTTVSAPARGELLADGATSAGCHGRTSGSCHLMVSCHGEPWHPPADEHFVGSSEWLARRNDPAPATEPPHLRRNFSVHVAHLGASERLNARAEAFAAEDRRACERPGCASTESWAFLAGPVRPKP
jgi:hypothetical protein